jgi:hypothetical protein
LYRKFIQLAGLTRVYNSADTRLKKVIKNLMASALLPAESIRGWYNDWKANLPADIRRMVDGNLESYFEPTWINADARIPMQLWVVYNLLNRTNNAIEAWHCGVQKMMAGQNTHLYRFVEVLRTIEAASHTRL